MWVAVKKARGKEAAWMKSTLAGFLTRALEGTTTFSA